MTEVDVAGTTVTGGKILTQFFIGKTGSIVISFGDYEFFMDPDDYFTFTGNTSSGNTDVSVSVNWIEDV